MVLASQHPLAWAVEPRHEQLGHGGLPRRARRGAGNDPSDANDTGVECYIDTEQNIVSNSTLNVQLRVKPYGYAKYINCYLGFTTASV